MNPTARNAYAGHMVATASPARLLVMLVERLERDVTQGLALQESGDFLAAGRQLIHAQEIVVELRASLRHDVWDGAAKLDAIYAWLHTELVKANVNRDVEATRGCLRVVAPLVATWREAAMSNALAG